MYSNGHGVVQDSGQALRWSRLAAEQGNASSQALLGMMYFGGEGVEQDFVTAYMWLMLSASGPGIGGARETMEGLTRFMTAEQIAEAEARVRNWGR